MEKFQNKYRIPSARAIWWDYGWKGLYFITICTHNRAHFFGDVVAARFIASPLGEIAATYWNEIPQQFPYAQLGEFVVMPNHIHGIIAIDKPPIETRFIASPTGDPANDPILPHQTGGFAGKNNPMLQENLARMVRWYKGRVTFESRKVHADFAWQTRFHDHIVRNETDYQNIAEYIVHNPARWLEDKFYSNESYLAW
jgi:putative transposase